jgi:hypothetical protein
METLAIGKLTFESFLALVDLEENPTQHYPWTQSRRNQQQQPQHTPQKNEPQIIFCCYTIRNTTV